MWSLGKHLPWFGRKKPEYDFSIFLRDWYCRGTSAYPGMIGKNMISVHFYETGVAVVLICLRS